MVDVKKYLNKRDNTNLFKELKAYSDSNVDVEKICRMRADAKSDLDMWRDRLQTAYHYSVPDYNPFENYGRGGLDMPGQQYNADVYDLTLPINHKRLADKMAMALVPQNTQWFNITPGDVFGEEGSPTYQRALEATQKMSEQVMKIINRSNFYLAVCESLSDTLISTGTIAINEGTRLDPISYESVPASHVMFRGDARGKIDGVFRDWLSVRVETIKSLWADADLSKVDKKGNDKVDIYECSWVDYDSDEDERYHYCVMLSNKTVIKYTKSSSWPWVPYRMGRLTGEVRGRGLTMLAQPTAATINKAIEDELRAAAFQSNPMFMAASDSAYNHETFTPEPGVIIPVQMHMGQWPIQPLLQSGNIQFGQLLVNDFRQQINDLMLAFPVGGIHAPVRTATEVEVRYTENLESFAAMAPRLHNEFYVPTLQRSLWVINKALPETFANIPEDIKKQMMSLDGRILNISFDTPLMSSRGQVKVDALMKFYQTVASMLGQEATTATLNPKQVVQSTARNFNVDLNNIKSDEELDQLVQAAGQQAAEQIQGV